MSGNDSGVPIVKESLLFGAVVRERAIGEAVMFGAHPVAPFAAAQHAVFPGFMPGKSIAAENETLRAALLQKQTEIGRLVANESAMKRQVEELERHIAAMKPIDRKPAAPNFAAGSARIGFGEPWRK